MTNDSVNRTLRTLMQAVAAMAAVLPIVSQVLEDAEEAFAASGLMGLAVVLVTALHTALEDKGHLRVLRPKGDVNDDVPPPGRAG